MKIKLQDNIIDILKKAKAGQLDQNKQMIKKIDSIWKNFRTYHKSHLQLVTKQNDQLCLYRAPMSMLVGHTKSIL